MENKAKIKTKQGLNNRGTAMMVAVVIIAILMVFTFALLLVSYTLFASQNKKVASRRNAEAANTLGLAITEELTNQAADEKSDLWRYLRCNIGQEDTWPYYLEGSNPDDPHGENNAFRYFNMDINHISAYDDYFGEAGEIDGFPGEVQLCIYWMPPENADPDTYTYGHSGIRLFIEVSCNTASQSYVTTNEYKLTVSAFDDSSSRDKKMQKALKNIADKKVYNPALVALTDIKQEEKWKWTFVSRQ